MQLACDSDHPIKVAKQETAAKSVASLSLSQQPAARLLWWEKRNRARPDHATPITVTHSGGYYATHTHDEVANCNKSDWCVLQGRRSAHGVIGSITCAPSALRPKRWELADTPATDSDSQAKYIISRALYGYFLSSTLLKIKRIPL